MRILFLVPHPWEGASSRYRVLQYVPHFEAAGIRCTVSSFLSKDFYRVAYQVGHWGRKGSCFLASSLRRLRDLLRSGRYDVVFIHLEAFPFGPPLIEQSLALRGIPFVFDLDDAIFLPTSRSAHLVARWLRRPQKLPAILRWSRHVITCNDYLRHYAEQFNPQVTVIPTCVDIQQFTPIIPRSARTRPVIGWVGSHSTAGYLDVLKPVLARLAQRFEFTLKIVGAGRPMQIPGVDIYQEPWTLAKDVSFFQDLDIGVYPLPDEPWVLGKTGFKTVQYMAVGVPCVVSAVGRNCEIVQDGVNGFLAHSEEEWYDRLARLLSDASLRSRLGAAGRRTVEERFAMQQYIPTYVDIFRKVAGEMVGVMEDSQLESAVLAGEREREGLA